MDSDGVLYSGDKALAIDLYRQGINELEAGIAINIRKSGITGDALTRAERLLELFSYPTQLMRPIYNHICIYIYIYIETVDLLMDLMAIGLLGHLQNTIENEDQLGNGQGPP